uniref:pectinesterase n=1 Tax=Physcomitrium patens TaxID=3218 RepID=A0A2K1J9B6_PHYPA|nr:hypothetical protein PHYPA_021233 [Physcomitrium patens]
MAALRVREVGLISLLVVVAVSFVLASVAAQGSDEKAIAFTALSRQPAQEGNEAEWNSYVERVVSRDIIKRKQMQTQELLGAMGVDDTMGVAAAVPKGRTIIVDKQGKGHFRKVQDAIDSIKEGNKKRITIIIRAGTYVEKCRIPKTKPFITLLGSGTKTVLVWSDTAGKAGGTALTPAPPGGSVGKQAVALRIQGDKGAFYRCRFFGAQDTLYDKQGRHYFRNCFIQGSIDWIFGNAQSMYHCCTIKSIAKRNSGSITAQKRSSKNSPTGFSFVRCKIFGTGSIYLGRAWGTHSRVVFIKCHMAKMILPIGWQDWNDPARQKTVFYAEYSCTGPGANREGRVKWSKLLSAKQAAPFYSYRFIDGHKWLNKT